MGEQDGAKVYFIEDDADPRSNILPPSILKEMQDRDKLKKLEERRGWTDSRLVKKGTKTLLQRHDASRPDEAASSGESTLMVDKTMKYLRRARDGLDNLKMFYGEEQATVLLNQLLDEVKRPGSDASPPLNQEAESSIRQAQLHACEATIKLFKAREEYDIDIRDLRDECRQIDLALAEEYPADISDEDYDAAQELISSMSPDELAIQRQNIHTAISPTNISLSTTALLREHGRPDYFFEQCDERGITLKSEIQRREKLQTSLAKISVVA